jgi:hypothetical protein
MVYLESEAVDSSAMALGFAFFRSGIVPESSSKIQNDFELLRKRNTDFQHSSKSDLNVTT